MNARKWHVPAVVAIVFVALLLAGRPGQAHKPITSPFTYNEDVFPIVRERCGQCHLPGGIAPMSLMTYKDAYPWGESIRTELIAGHMPPWSVDAGLGNLRNPRTLTARELNVLLTWASGGNPVGNADHTPAPVALSRDWRLGMPDLVLPLPSDFTLPPGTTETTAEFTLPTATKEAKWVRAVDLLPGNPAVVRSATVAIKSSKAANDAADGLAPETVLAVWVPGEEPVPLRDGAAFRLPAGADLMLRVRYKKTWEYERVEMSDRSTVGVYFASPPASEVRALTLQAGTDAAKGDASRFTIDHIVGNDVKALALYPESGARPHHGTGVCDTSRRLADRDDSLPPATGLGPPLLVRRAGGPAARFANPGRRHARHPVAPAGIGAVRVQAVGPGVGQAHARRRLTMTSLNLRI